MAGEPRERILLVDDDDSIRQVVTVFLTDEGYDVAGAGDGQAALDLVAIRIGRAEEVGDLEADNDVAVGDGGRAAQGLVERMT